MTLITSTVYQYAIGPIYPLAQVTVSNHMNRPIGPETRLVLGIGYRLNLYRYYRLPRDQLNYLRRDFPVPESGRDIKPNLNLLYTCRQIHEEAVPGV